MPTGSNVSQATIEIGLPAKADLPAATPANWFRFSWSGGIEVQLMTGYVDFTPGAEATAPVNVTRVIPEVGHRIFMSVRGFAILYAQVQDAANSLRAQGVPVEQLVAEFTQVNE